ncbi:TonB-dependent receptor [Hymenobacter sp. BT18]|uniref:TonB-dependent receptor plug domain-containing protein n=1 Tax=Hymenobacter sp. BT18 TaxID=2835648 RepID=UPI00143EB406|nr:TonB-dependent receptor [Hymenobacter sp. BT18]QIX61130.1 TonB-dependent receptor [Hymenobacter sp. BT18]
MSCATNPRWRLYRVGLALGSGLFALPAALAQQPLSPDSVQVLPMVRVEVERPRQYAVGTRVLTLDSTTLALYRSGSLADVLAARTPLYLKSYGPGQLSSSTMRGTSAQHTAILWNGFNVMLPTLGQNDFTLLPLSGVQQVEVQPGPASGLYGSGAIGGTVLLSSPVSWRQGFRGAAQIEVGSFGLGAGSLQAGFSNQRLALRISASYRAAQNNFPYDFPGGGRPRQTNAAFWQGSLAQDIAWRVGQNGQVQAAAWLTKADRQIQPAIGTQNDHARQLDQSTRLLLGYEHTGMRQQSSVRVAWFEDILNYATDAFRSDSRVHTTQAQASHTVRLGTSASLRLGAEAQHFAVRMTDYGGFVSENRFAGFGLLRYDPTARLRLSATVRQAMLPGRQVPLTPVLGLEWQTLRTSTQQLLVKVSAARGYRAPTLNERYYQPGGDPNLRPETSQGYELGLHHSWQAPTQPKLTWHTELTAYRQRVDNWVMWWPKPGESFVSPRNLRQVKTQGLEASSSLQWRATATFWQARAAYAYTRAYKSQDDVSGATITDRQLLYVPLHTAALSADGRWHRWQAGGTATFTGYRYTEDTGPSFLPSYTLLDANLGYTWPQLAGQPAALTLLAQVRNLTNQSYQSYLYRAQPPRAVQISLRLTWR